MIGMAASLNSFVGFNSKGSYLHMCRSYTGASLVSKTQVRFKLRARPDLHLAAAKTGQFAVNSSNEGPTSSEDLVSEDRFSDSPPSESSRSDVAGSNSKPSTLESPNGAIFSPETASGQSSNPKSPPKRSPLTARERLRAARVLSKYTNAKPSKSEMGSRVLDAIKQSEGGKRRSRLPEAPTNLFDDNKRGLPKEGFTFQLPEGADLLVIALSFVLISTVMFATTYIVWKVGAIHFNEY